MSLPPSARRTSFALCALLSGALGVLAQSTWTADDDGPADFASVRAAVDAAAPGDALVIRSGDYGIVQRDDQGADLARGPRRVPARGLRGRALALRRAEEAQVGQALAPPRPFQTLKGGSLPGEVQTLTYRGREDANGLVIASLAPPWIHLPGLDTVPAYVNPAQLLQILPLILQGNDTPVRASWTLPGDPSLARTPFFVQGLKGKLAGGFVGTKAELVFIGQSS